MQKPIKRKFMNHINLCITVAQILCWIIVMKEFEIFIFLQIYLVWRQLAWKDIKNLFSGSMDSKIFNKFWTMLFLFHSKISKRCWIKRCYILYQEQHRLLPQSSWPIFELASSFVSNAIKTAGLCRNIPRGNLYLQPICPIYTLPCY